MQTPDRSWPPHPASRTDTDSNPGSGWRATSSDQPSMGVDDYNVPTEQLNYGRSPASSPPHWPLARRLEEQASHFNNFALVLAATTVSCIVAVLLAIVVAVQLQGGASGNTPAATLPPTTTPIPSPTASPTPLVGATFTSTDTTTQGNWQGVYGSQGYLLAGDAQQLPATIQVTLSGQSGFVWAASTADSRAPQKASTPGDRIAACWYSSTSFTIAVDLTDGQPHQMALYLLDWDQLNRVENITVLDATTGAELDTRTISNFGNGEYLVWQVHGNIVVRVTNESSSLNAVVSGLFFS